MRVHETSCAGQVFEVSLHPSLSEENLDVLAGPCEEAMKEEHLDVLAGPCEEAMKAVNCLCVRP